MLILSLLTLVDESIQKWCFPRHDSTASFELLNDFQEAREGCGMKSCGISALPTQNIIHLADAPLWVPHLSMFVHVYEVRYS